MAAAASRITGGEVLLNGSDILTARQGQVSAQMRGVRVCYVAQSAAAAFNPGAQARWTR